jgi:hypothetical protein
MPDTHDIGRVVFEMKTALSYADKQLQYATREELKWYKEQVRYELEYHNNKLEELIRCSTSTMQN